MNKLLIIISCIIIVVFILELWTVLRSITRLSNDNHLQEKNEEDIEKIIVNNNNNNNDENVFIEDDEATIKMKIMQLVNMFNKEHVNENAMMIFAKKTNLLVPSSQKDYYEKYITAMVKERISSWPYVTQLNMARIGAIVKAKMMKENYIS